MPPAPATPAPRFGGAAGGVDAAQVLMLQRTAGNAAVGRLLARAPQPPATVDPFDLDD